MPPSAKEIYTPQSTNGWTQWSNHVLKELDRLNEAAEATNKQLSDIRVEIAMLKVKSGLWGMAGAAVPVALALIVEFLKH